MRIGQGVRTGLGHGGITCVLQTQFSSLSIYFYLIFFLVYIIWILLLTYDKGHRLRMFYIYSIYIKVWCKKFAFRKR